MVVALRKSLEKFRQQNSKLLLLLNDENRGGSILGGFSSKMRRVSFKGLRLSFRSKEGNDKRSASDEEETERIPPADDVGDDNDVTVVTNSSQPEQTADLENTNEPTYVSTHEIQLPQRKEKQSILRTIRRKITASFHKKHSTSSNSEESVATLRKNRSKKKAKKKTTKTRQFSSSHAHTEKPSNTSDEFYSETIHHPSSKIGSADKRETHSSCSSDSCCEHDVNGARCSKISVNVHTTSCGERRLAKNCANSSPSVSTLRKVDYSSPGEVQVLCSGSLRSATSVLIRTTEPSQSPGATTPVVPPRPDMLTVNDLFSPQTMNSFSLFNLMAFRADNILMMRRYEASLQSPVYDEVRGDVPKIWSLTKELLKLSRFGWYWGPLTRVEAEEKLSQQPNGAFLVRDSSDDRYLLSLSFRSNERTLHTRIEHCNGMFSFYAQPELEGYTSIVDLIEHSMNDSLSGVFCYSRARAPGEPSFPVRLTKPVSRFTQVRSLQYLCRFVIRQFTRLDHIQKLPLPNQIKGWLEENQY